MFKAKLKHALYQISFHISPSITLPDFSFITLNQFSHPSHHLRTLHFHSFASIQAPMATKFPFYSVVILRWL